MQKIFESRKDLRRELLTIKKFIKKNKLKYTYEKLDWKSLDYELYECKKLVAVVEIKNFKVAWGFFPTVLVALKKYIKMLGVKEEKDVPVYFMAHFYCGTIAWIEVDQIDGENKHFERNEIREGAASDAEEVFYVVNELFKTI